MNQIINIYNMSKLNCKILCINFFSQWRKKNDLHVFDQKIPKANISGHPRVILLAIAVSLFQNCNSKLSDMHHCN